MEVEHWNDNTLSEDGINVGVSCEVVSYETCVVAGMYVVGGVVICSEFDDEEYRRGRVIVVEGLSLVSDCIATDETITEETTDRGVVSRSIVDLR